jgi:hypothetical protein
MSGAHFTINQAANDTPSGTLDVARTDIWQGQVVHFIGDNSSGQPSPQWTILSWEPGAAQTQPSGAGTFDASYTFATPGSYLCEFVVGDGLGANAVRFIVLSVTKTDKLTIVAGAPALAKASG